MVGMIEDILDKTWESVVYSARNLGAHPTRWFLFIVLMCIPFVNYIVFGILLKIEWKQEYNFKNPFEVWFNGFRMMMIYLAYEALPMLLIVGFELHELRTKIGNPDSESAIDYINNLLPSVVGIDAFGILTVILPVLFLMLAIPAEIAFARNGFVAAFDFDILMKLIHGAGWVKFVVAFVLNILVASGLFSLYLIIGHLSSIGAIIAVAALLLLLPHILTMEGRFWTLFFEETEEVSKNEL